MVLPLLLSLGLPAIASTGALGATLAGFGVPALAGMGAGLGSFIETGDIGKGIKTGLTSFLGGKVMGGLTNSASTTALNASTAQPQVQQGFLKGIVGPSAPVSGITAAPDGMITKFIGSEAAASQLPFTNPAVVGPTGGTKGGALTAAQQAFTPAYMGQVMTDAQMMEEEAKRAAKKRDDEESTVPPLNPMRRTQNADPFMSGGGEGTYFQYQRQPRPDGSEIKAPYYYAEGGKLDMGAIAEKAMELFGDVSESSIGKVMRMLTPMSGGIAALMGASGEDMPEGVRKLGRGLQRVGSYTLPPYALKGMGYDRAADVMGYPFDDEGELRPQYKAEGGEMQADEVMAESGMNEKDVIVDAIEAIKGMSEQPEIVLALFVQKYGEEALRDLVGRVQSGELDDTVERFAEGDKGMVRGPGDGSGVDDMVPATLEGEQDVLLSDGEFVLREKTTDALEKAYGGGFLDVINRAEEEAPRKLQQMVG